MNRSVWIKKLKFLVDIRPEEISQTVLMFAYFFLVIASHTIIKSTRDALFINKYGAEQLPYVYIGIAIVAPVGKLHVVQPSTTGAKPVITLDQADIDEDYFKFIGTSDTNVDRALVDAADFTTPGAIVGWLKINIQDDQATNPIVDGDYYIPFYAAPTA